jgi:hypothetical protein
VPAAFERLLAAGGSALGEVTRTEGARGGWLDLVYARDPEGNIIELQAWS